MTRWALILALLMTSGTWCARQAKADDNERNWLATLLNPNVAPAQTHNIFEDLELRRNHERKKWVVERLTEKINNLDDRIADRARWALWCLLGPDRYHATISHRPLRPLKLRDTEHSPLPFDLDLPVIVWQHTESADASLLRDIDLILSQGRAGLSKAQAIAAQWHARLNELSAVWNPQTGYPQNPPGSEIPSLFLLQAMVAEPERHDELLALMEKRLKSSVIGVPTSTAELARKLTGTTRDRFVARLVELILTGRPELRPLLGEARITKDEAGRVTLSLLTQGTPTTRRTVVQILKETGWEGTQTAKALLAIARSLDAQASRDAAEFLGTEEAFHLAKVSQLLSALRDQSKVERVMAAVRLNELALYPKPLTTALVKAAEEGNMVVREGILAALEESFTSGREVNATLSELAQRRDVQGIYARAALAAVRE